MAFFVCNSNAGVKHEIRRQISVYFENSQTVIQSTSMAEFSFRFYEARRKQFGSGAASCDQNPAGALGAL